MDLVHNLLILFSYLIIGGYGYYKLFVDNPIKRDEELMERYVYLKFKRQGYYKMQDDGSYRHTIP